MEKPLKISGAIGDYTKTYDNYIRPVYGDLALIAVTNDIVLELHAKKTAPVMRASGKMSQPRNRSANKAVSLLGSVFSYAIVFYKDEAGARIYTYNPVDIMTALGNWHDNKRDKIRVNPNELGELLSQVQSKLVMLSHGAKSQPHLKLHQQLFSLCFFRVFVLAKLRRSEKAMFVMKPDILYYLLVTKLMSLIR